MKKNFLCEVSSLLASTILFISVFSVALVPNLAFADNTGYINGGTFTDSGDDMSEQFWDNETAVQTSNNFYANSNFSVFSFDGNPVIKNSYLLKATNFDFSAIPSGATITGIELKVERSVLYGGSFLTQDKTIKLIKGGVVSGDNKASATSWSTADSVVTYGGDGQLWGLTLTPSDLLASNFGIALQVQYTMSGWAPATEEVRVDHMSLNVYYTLSSPSNNLSSISISGTPSGFTFASSTYSYPSVTVPNTQTGIAITASADAGTITVNGETIVSGGTSSSTALTAGVAKVIDVVVTESGKAPTAYTITVTRDLSNTKAITDFSFPEGTGVISGTDIAVNVPFGKNVTALVPTITHTGVSVSPVSGLANDFTATTTYTVTAEDSSTQDYAVSVTVATPSSIATITSGTYTVSAGGTASETITSVPLNTSKTALLAALTKGETNQIWNTTSIADPVVTGNTLVVTAENTTTVVTYTITILTPAIVDNGGGGIAGSGPTSVGYIRTYPETITPVSVTPITPVSILINAVFSTDLFRGNNNDDVRRLQELLAGDKSLYPEGIVNGIFGPLTEKAVKAFQAKYSISQVGRVGPLTRAKLQEIYGGVSPSTLSQSEISIIIEQIKILQSKVIELMKLL